MFINFLLNVFCLFFLDLWVWKILECKENWPFTSCNKKRICNRSLVVHEQVYNKYVACLQVSNFFNVWSWSYSNPMNTIGENDLLFWGSCI
jgi:hypothetical protein